MAEGSIISGWVGGRTMDPFRIVGSRMEEEQLSLMTVGFPSNFGALKTGVGAV